MKVNLKPERMPTRIVGIGASAGGLEAITEFFSKLPDNTGMAFVVIVHTDPHRPSNLAEILQRITRSPIEKIVEGIALKANHVYTAPSDKDVIVEGNSLRVVERGFRGHIHMPIDTLFSSIAQMSGSASIGIVLSGTGSDGTLGLRDIQTAGGITFAQDEASAVHFKMPKSAIAAGYVDHILAPQEMSEALAHLAALKKDSPSASDDVATTREILAILKKSFDVDFSEYKGTTISRRIQKRILTSKFTTLKDYLAILKEDSSEQQALYRDILINVTTFFSGSRNVCRDGKQNFPENYSRKVSRRAGTHLVPGCSSGEEVYSLAISLTQYTKDKGYTLPLQFFGTDVSESALEKARQGIYPQAISSHLTEGQLVEFFEPVRKGYQVKRFLRDCCVFAKQNVIADPPLSKMDLISCRNLLIYFGPVLQERIVPIFHYALKSENGFLVLGKSEIVDINSDYFLLSDRINKFYMKKNVPAHVPFQPVPRGKSISKDEPTKTSVLTKGPMDLEQDVYNEADRFILANCSPAGVLVTENMDIIQFRGQTTPYLQPIGRASFQLFKMIHPDLLQTVRSGIAKSKGSSLRTVKCSRIRVVVEEEEKFVNVRIVPLKNPQFKQTYFLILFEEVTASRPKHLHEGESQIVQSGESSELQRLTEELSDTRRHLQTVIDEREIGFEELQSSNEEVISSNEELQTINQELETAKEELESSNEALSTLNQQLTHNMEQLRASEAHLNALIAGVKDYAIFMLDAKGRILSWNSGAEKIKGYTKNEVIGRHFSIFYTEEDKKAHKPEAELVVAAKVGRFEEEGIRIKKRWNYFLGERHYFTAI